MLDEIESEESNKGEMLEFLSNYINKEDGIERFIKTKELIVKYFGFDAAS